MNKILDLSKLKAFADEKNRDVHEMIISLSNAVENIVVKGENAGYQHFFLFLLCFQTPSFSGSLKVGIMWYRVTWSYKTSYKTYKTYLIQNLIQNLIDQTKTLQGFNPLLSYTIFHLSTWKAFASYNSMSHE